jgi:hypothetical protein
MKGVPSGNESAIGDGKRLPVRLLLKDGAEPQQFIFHQEWHNVSELHFFFFTIAEAGYMLVLHQRPALVLNVAKYAG